MVPAALAADIVAVEERMSPAARSVIAPIMAYLWLASCRPARAVIVDMRGLAGQNDLGELGEGEAKFAVGGDPPPVLVSWLIPRLGSTSGSRCGPVACALGVRS